ncbi:MAG: NADH-quinone oxidoreductase subunit N [Dehalococcoidia bacterium]|nr:MAG: NADH-quinone oxidoreductase subunit N [Dehalococcoidia bacterium]
MNFWLLSPELSLCGIALVVILLDLFIEQKKALAGISVLGLIIPLAFTIALWGEQQASFSGMLVVDNFSLFFKFLILGIAALVILSSVDYVSKFARFQGEYYALILLSAGGMMLMASTGELISIYIALELASISLYVLASFLKDPKSSEAGLKYMILGAISSAVLLLGMAFVFGLTGTTHLDQIAANVGGLVSGGQLTDSPALLLGIVLLVAGFGFKIASVPFQMWVPDVYEGAPTPITAYLSVASKAAGFAVILRVFYTAFGAETISGDWAMIFAVLAAISMTLGNVVAIAQSNIKRMLAYSSIAHAGYIMIGLAAIGTLGKSGVLFFLAGYALANLGAFIAIIAISNKTGSDEITDYSGMARRSPVIAFILAFCLISLIGIPPTVGFMAKFYIFNAAIQENLLWLVIIAVLNSVVSAYYYLRVVRLMYVGEPASEEAIPSSIPLRISLAITSLGVLVLGIYPWLVIRLAENAVAAFPLP